MPNASLNTRRETLLKAIEAMGPVVIALSGGVDSLVLLHAARTALPPDRILAATLETDYVPAREMSAAVDAARRLHVRHVTVRVPFPEAIRHNPPDRCHLCKRTLFSRLADLARDHGGAGVLDGTNADDAGEHRPGIKALRELGVRSPLLEAGLGKADIRALARSWGLDGWDRPSSACLLTRIPHGTRITIPELRRIEAAEEFLRGIGFPAVRVRSHGDTARIEVPAGSVAALAAADPEHGIDRTLRSLGYRHVAVDLAGYRTGSLDPAGDSNIKP